MNVKELREKIQDLDDEMEIGIEVDEILYEVECYTESPEVVDKPFMVLWSKELNEVFARSVKNVEGWLSRAQAAEKQVRKLHRENQELIEGLIEIRNNLRCIDGGNEADEYIDEALDIAIKLLKECGADE